MLREQLNELPSKELIEIIEEQKEIINDYDKSARKFIDKVDVGKARSIETYGDLKACYERKEAISKHISKYHS